MSYSFTGHDAEGNPTHVCTDNGFIQTNRSFNKDEDGWMLDQLNPYDFEAIKIGKQMEDLIMEVNYLRRKVFKLKKERS